MKESFNRAKLICCLALILPAVCANSAMAKVETTPETEKIRPVLKEANNLDITISDLIQKVLPLCDASPQFDALDKAGWERRSRTARLKEG